MKKRKIFQKFGQNTKPFVRVSFLDRKKLCIIASHQCTCLYTCMYTLKLLRNNMLVTSSNLKDGWSVTVNRCKTKATP